MSKEEYRSEVAGLRWQLLDAQRQLRSQPFPLIVVFGGVDGAGKSETVHLLNEWMDPRWILTRAFGEQSEEERERSRRWQALAGELTTSLHEVIGHGSGRMAAHVGAPQAVLREQYSALEETRSDLVALYFIADPVMVELGLIEAADHADVVRAEYEGYARNALVQLRRVRKGTQLEEDHMRNRQAIVHWLMVDHEGKLFRVKVKDPSFANWPALSFALLNNIVPDFPLCNKSFNQSYSGNDL